MAYVYALYIFQKSSSQRVLGLPIGPLDMGFHLLIFCTILSSAMRSTWLNQFNLCFLINSNNQCAPRKFAESRQLRDLRFSQKYPEIRRRVNWSRVTDVSNEIVASNFRVWVRGLLIHVLNMMAAKFIETSASVYKWKGSHIESSKTQLPWLNGKWTTTYTPIAGHWGAPAPPWNVDIWSFIKTTKKIYKNKTE